MAREQRLLSLEPLIRVAATCVHSQQLHSNERAQQASPSTDCKCKIINTARVREAPINSSAAAQSAPRENFANLTAAGCRDVAIGISILCLVCSAWCGAPRYTRRRRHLATGRQAGPNEFQQQKPRRNAIISSSGAAASTLQLENPQQAISR